MAGMGGSVNFFKINSEEIYSKWQHFALTQVFTVSRQKHHHYPGQLVHKNLFILELNRNRQCGEMKESRDPSVQSPLNLSGWRSGGRVPLQPSSGVESSGVDESSANSSVEPLLWMRPSLRMLWKVLRKASIMECASVLASSLLSHSTAWQSIWKERSSLISR